MTDADLTGLDEREVRLVTLATKRATQAIAAKNRRRLMAWGAVIGAACAAAIAIPTTYIVTHENDARQHATQIANARSNCRLITELAELGVKRAKGEKTKVQKKRDQVERFEKQSHDRLGLSPEAFEKLVAEQIGEVEAEEEEQRHRQVVTDRIASFNCAGLS